MHHAHDQVLRHRGGPSNSFRQASRPAILAEPQAIAAADRVFIEGGLASHGKQNMRPAELPFQPLADNYFQGRKNDALEFAKALIGSHVPGSHSFDNDYGGGRGA